MIFKKIEKLTRWIEIKQLQLEFTGMFFVAQNMIDYLYYFCIFIFFIIIFFYEYVSLIGTKFVLYR